MHASAVFKLFAPKVPKLIIGQSPYINIGSRLNKALLLIYFWPLMRVRTAYHVFVIDSDVKTILSLTKWERESHLATIFAPSTDCVSFTILTASSGFCKWSRLILRKKDEIKKKTEESLNLRKKLSLVKNNCKNNPAFKDQELLAITDDHSFASRSAFLLGINQLGLCNIVMGIQDTNRIHVMDANTQSTILMI